MIIKNPIIRSGLIVYSFWYVVLYLAFALWGRYGPWWVIEDYPLSLAAIALGAGAGIAMTAGAKALRLQRLETEIRNGEDCRGARISMGKLPRAAEPPRNAAIAGHMAIVRKRKWWKVLEKDFPGHARALEAVVAVMAARPALPASPVPGGHGGRTLFVHSLAVTDTMVKLAGTWQYKGQKNNRGKIRVGLRDTQGPHHSFKRRDLGLLTLTAFAHDIGKVTCYEDTGKRDGKLEHVREALPNHDVEGARLLRTLPEIMALPYVERRALLLAVGFYHHAGSISDSDAITDRMRSLTELLIRADVAVGKAEGDTAAASAYDSGDGEDEIVKADMVSVDAVTGGSAAETTAAKPSASDPAEQPVDRATDDGLPFELSLLYRILADRSSIGGRVQDKLKRVGFKFDGKLWLIDEAVKGQVATMTNMGVVEQSRELLGIGDGGSHGKKASPFTARLLKQLHDSGKLMVEWKGKDLPPESAVFDVSSPKLGKKYSGMFIINADVLASTFRLPDDAPMVIERPLWGPRSARKPLNEIQGELPMGVAAADAPEESAQAEAEQVPPATATAAAEPEADDAIEIEAASPEADANSDSTFAEACVQFVEAFKDAVIIGRATDGSGTRVGAIRRSDNPAAVDAFIMVLDDLDSEGIDVSAAVRHVDSTGVVVAVRFPLPDAE